MWYINLVCFSQSKTMGIIKILKLERVFSVFTCRVCLCPRLKTFWTEGSLWHEKEPLFSKFWMLFFSLCYLIISVFARERSHYLDHFLWLIRLIPVCLSFWNGWCSWTEFFFIWSRLKHFSLNVISLYEFTSRQIHMCRVVCKLTLLKRALRQPRPLT